MIFKSILVFLCKDTECSCVAQQAIRFASRERARMAALYVVDEADLTLAPGTEGISPETWRALVEPGLRTEGERMLGDFTAQCGQVGIPVETRVMVGPVANLVCRQAHTADLIVLGRRGEHAHRRALLQCSHLENVIRRASRPVLIAASEPRDVTRVLVAYDGSAGASVALSLAAHLCADWQVSLVLLTVVEKGVGREALMEGQTYLEQHKQPDKIIVTEGIPSEEILRVAKEQYTDLIVMGAYCHGRVRELLLGGTVGQVVQNAECPVLICH